MRTLVVAIAILVALPRVAVAHQSSLTHSQVDVGEAEARYAILIDPPDAAEALGLPADQAPTKAEVDANADRLVGYVTRRIAVRDGATPCPPADAAVAHGGAKIRVAWTARCPAPITQLVVEYELFFDLDPTHEAVLRVAAAGESVDTVLRDGAARFVWDLADPPPSGVLAFLASGVDHIVYGFDHIAFVLALLIVVVIARDASGWRRRRLGEALRATALIVTSFTVAHSITLIAASLGWMAIPSRLVEAMIALSIVYTAVEDVVRPDVRWRFVLTFGFGLLHGLGFASMLEVLLPPDDVVVPLLAFNVGVELGQLAIVAIALPACWWLCGAIGADRYRRVALPALGGALALAGLVWLVDRVV